MAYTSSALSFLLEDLGKTVIITGAQIPLSQLRNDATDNLMGSLTIAGHYIIPGKGPFYRCWESAQTDVFRMLPVLQPHLVQREPKHEGILLRSKCL